MGRDMTDKQRLIAHLEEHHRLIPRTKTFTEMGKLHAMEHHERWCDHIHAGANLGPNDRPPGWRTGEGVVARVTPMTWPARCR